jgi:membrane-bound lytic murein transglycosylase MltF
MKLDKKYYPFLLAGIIFLLVILFLIIFKKESVNPSERDYEEIRRSGVMNVVMDYSPASYFRSDDSIYGLQYELVKQMEEYLDIPVEIHLETGLAESIEGLNEGKYDLIARFIPVTTELRESVAFTENFSLDRQVLVQRIRQDTTAIYISNQLELPGREIYVTKSSPYIARIRNLADEIGDTIKVSEIDDYECEHLLILVAKGDIDYAVCDYETASRMHSEYPMLDITTQISFSQLQAWAVRKNSPQLLDVINRWIQEIIKS